MTLKKDMRFNALSYVQANLAPLSRIFCQHPYPWMGGWLPAILPDGHPPPFPEHLLLASANFSRVSLPLGGIWFPGSASKVPTPSL